MLLNENCYTNFAASTNMQKCFTSKIVCGEMSGAEMAETLTFSEKVWMEEDTQL